MYVFIKQFLQKEELSNFNFQRLFLKPFEKIMSASKSTETKVTHPFLEYLDQTCSNSTLQHTPIVPILLPQLATISSTTVDFVTIVSDFGILERSGNASRFFDHYTMDLLTGRSIV